MSNINNKTASRTFLLIIFASLIFSMIIVSLKEGGAINLDDFWTSSAITVVQYALYLSVFIYMCRRVGLSGREVRSEFRINKRLGAKNVYIQVLIAGLGIASFILVTAGALALFKEIGYNEPEEPTLVAGLSGFGRYIACVVALALLPAVVEELLFRGIILRGLSDYGKVRAIIFSALLFCLYHMSPAQTVYQFALGIMLASVFFASGNLVYCMILHFVNNFAVITYTYITGDPTASLAFDLQTVLVGCVLLVFGILFIVGLVKALGGALATDKEGRRAERMQCVSDKRFVSSDNIGYFMCIGLTGLVWLIQFLG